MSGRLRRVNRIEAAHRQAHTPPVPPTPPGVVFVLPSRLDRPPGR